MTTTLNKEGFVALSKLEQLNETSLNAQITNMVLGVICYFVIKNPENSTAINIWFSGFIFVFIARSALLMYHKKSYKNITSENAKTYLNQHRAGVFASCLVWAIGSLTIYPSGNPDAVLFFIFIVMGIVAGALITYSIDSLSVHLFPVIILLPLTCRVTIDLLTTKSSGEFRYILIGIIIYFIFVMINTKKFSMDRENLIASNYELMLSRREIAVSEKRYKLLLNHSPVAIIHYDMDFNISYFNQRLLDIAGADEDKMFSLNLENLQDQDPVMSGKDAIQNGKITRYSGAYKMSLKDKTLWINMISAPIKDHNNDIVGGISIIQDATEQKKAEDKIKKLAFYDPLTHLPNRRMLTKELNSTIKLTMEPSNYGAIMFLDLDNFKSINDTLGHDYGDLLLKEASRRLKNCIKKSDIVARFGGDEFIVLIKGHNTNIQAMKENARNIANRILKVLNEPFDLLGNKHTTSVSIGAVIFGDRDDTQKDLLKYADIAMYQAKKAGKNVIRFFDLNMQFEITKRVSTETQLIDAIKNKEFALHYQPQINDKGTIYGVEALIRWEHPTKGMIFPGDFIAIAEEKGLIIDIGHVVMEVAFKQLLEWKKMPKMQNIKISINISAVQFSQDDFVEKLFLLLDKYKVDTSQIKLEITEGTLLECSEQIIQNMLTIRKRGIKFSLDDFGIGYSSLLYLKKLPIDELKIDQTFVRDITFDSNDYDIVQTIIAMAKSFNFHIIAEGVETIEQLKILQDSDCSCFQGYFFSKPIPPKELEAFMEENDGNLIHKMVS